MVKKELPKRVFKKGKKPLGKTSGKIREKKADVPILGSEKKRSVVQLPKINQVIPVWKLKLPSFSLTQAGWVSLLIVGGVFLVWQLFVLAAVYPTISRLIAERSALEAELRIWQNISSQYPTYRDAHFSSALLAYRLGERNTLEIELKKVLDIDPNFQPALVLQKEK